LDSDTTPLTERVSRCRQHISRWKRNHKTNAEERIRDIRYRLDKAVSEGTSTPREIHNLKSELNQAYIDEEMFWKLRSRNKWTHEGDKNTKYFHEVTKGRRARNKIISIEDKDGVSTRGKTAIADIAVTYFRELFRSSTPSVALQSEFSEIFRQESQTR